MYECLILNIFSKSYWKKRMLGFNFNNFIELRCCEGFNRGVVFILVMD